MRKKLVLLAVVLLVLALGTPAFAQGGGAAAPSFAVSLNPLGLLFGIISGSFEFRLMDNLSVYIPAAYYNSDISLIFPTSGFYNATYLGVEGHVRYYLLDKTFQMNSTALDGLWLGGGGGVQIWSFTWSGTTYPSTIIMISALAGFKYTFGQGQGFYLEPMAGYSFGIGTLDIGGYGLSVATGGFIIGIGLGYAF